MESVGAGEDKVDFPETMEHYKNNSSGKGRGRGGWDRIVLMITVLNAWKWFFLVLVKLLVIWMIYWSRVGRRTCICVRFGWPIWCCVGRQALKIMTTTRDIGSRQANQTRKTHRNRRWPNDWTTSWLTALVIFQICTDSFIGDLLRYHGHLTIPSLHVVGLFQSVADEKEAEEDNERSVDSITKDSTPSSSLLSRVDSSKLVLDAPGQLQVGVGSLGIVGVE